VLPYKDLVVRIIIRILVQVVVQFVLNLITSMNFSFVLILVRSAIICMPGLQSKARQRAYLVELHNDIRLPVQTQLFNKVIELYFQRYDLR
jgi:hypothetical protein